MGRDWLNLESEEMMVPSRKHRESVIRVVLVSLATVMMTSGAIMAQGNLPEKQEYELIVKHSRVTFVTIAGSFTSTVNGRLRVFLGDPSVPGSGIPGEVGLSIYRADLAAPQLPAMFGSPYVLDPDFNFPSIGFYNTNSRHIEFRLNLVSDSGISPPVPFALLMRGTLSGEYMAVAGENDAFPDNGVSLTLGVIRRDILFSTEVEFHPGVDPTGAGVVSNGDLISEAGQVVATNRHLTRNLGMKPVSADIGLDAVFQKGIGERFFSSEYDDFSETLGPLGNGDLLGEAGRIAATNTELLDAFVPMPPTPDLGLDAVHLLPGGLVLFSTEQPFFSEALGISISDGDLLSDTGLRIMNQFQLLSQFAPMGPTTDYGLDALVFPPPRVNAVANFEVWFSTEEPFVDFNLGPISDGDLLSSNGYVVRRNLELVAEFAPIEDLDNFGLDAVHIRRVIGGDMNSDNVVDLIDFISFVSCFGVTNVDALPAGCSPVEFLAADINGDGDVDLVDFLTFSGSFTG